MRARAAAHLWLGFLIGSCASSPEPVPLEAFMRVGVAPDEEAAQVRATLEAAGWTTTRTLERPRYIALAFRRAENERAVRVVTSRGVVVALDSLEPDGVQTRHGLVDLAEGAPRDLDGDGEEELVLVRSDGPTPCLAIVRFEEDGRANLAPDDAAALREGACVSRLEDVDADGTMEAMVPLAWPELSVGGAPATVDVALVAREGGWRADGMPVVYVERVRAARQAALESALARRDVGRAVTLAVEVAAFAHLTGASVAAQVERFDEALSGFVISAAERDRISEIRAVIGSGWRDPTR